MTSIQFGSGYPGFSYGMQNTAVNPSQQPSNVRLSGKNAPFTNAVSDLLSQAESEKTKQTQKMRQLLRGLQETAKQDTNPFAATSEDRINGFMDLSETGEREEEEKDKEHVSYNYKEVATKIRQAKTSQSAGRAVLSAKRKVMEIKRDVASGKGDAEELQLALTHAKRMEMAARKKKNHLELEELIVTTQKRDEKLEQMEETATGVKNALVTAGEEAASKKEDEIFEERSEMIYEAEKEAAERKSENTEKMLTELNQLIAEFGEEELQKLEETMELFETMEVMDPHMSREELEDLKRKHRASENKALVNADMDYLKDMIRHQQLQAQFSQTPGMTGNMMGSFSGDLSSLSMPRISAGSEVTGFDSAAGPSIDVQV